MSQISENLREKKSLYKAQDIFSNYNQSCSQASLSVYPLGKHLPTLSNTYNKIMYPNTPPIARGSWDLEST